ncbi:alpha-keto acid decarboxylase family protein [Calothrix sp. UHCC 0171]|uniref:alpha-keto acid decarboxylase family protein n=1 Tax=Calothrix sp. UHCC 0171 TaxID=3110245 RepID=UPI002B1FB295|nr:thiamine pyrophosphate-binding protein [Calothrix sp. UHCC 0171]MEA5574230.1 thiamine pyrophosphate-binding protein [Calothrix sp. UHCC 0171]
MTTKITIGEYLLQRLSHHGVEHIFGVPGDYVLKFMTLIENSDIQLINTCDEQGAGFAADAYARLRGLGVVCITYGVGGLKVANTTAQGFAELSPVVIISGAPGIEERIRHPLIHHKVRDFDTQKKVFEQLTVASTVLDNPETALEEIDRVLAAALRFKRPVYIEIPRDMVMVTAKRSHHQIISKPKSDSETLKVALSEAINLIKNARQPVILAGEELHRFRLQNVLLDIIRKSNIPFAATILGKSVIDEDEPAYLGIYQGGIGQQEVRQYVESSDCIIMLGVMMTDINLGIYTARLERDRCIHAFSEKLSIGYHVYEDVQFADFMDGLAAADLGNRELHCHPNCKPIPDYKVEEPNKPISVERLFASLNAFLSENTIVISDVGDALFGAADLTVHQNTAFISPAYYASLGFAVPAAIGAQMAKPELRPLVLVGDGAFQMTGMELSAAARFGCNPIVIVLNNGGYVTERYIIDGGFNDILPWDYSRLPEVFGKGRGFLVKTEGELEVALQEAALHTESFCILDVRLDKMDASSTLKRLAKGLI